MFFLAKNALVVLEISYLIIYKSLSKFHSIQKNYVCSSSPLRREWQNQSKVFFLKFLYVHDFLHAFTRPLYLVFLSLMRSGATVQHTQKRQIHSTATKPQTSNNPLLRIISWEMTKIWVKYSAEKFTQPAAIHVYKYYKYMDRGLA